MMRRRIQPDYPIHPLQGRLVDGKFKTIQDKEVFVCRASQPDSDYPADRTLHIPAWFIT